MLTPKMNAMIQFEQTLKTKCYQWKTTTSSTVSCSEHCVTLLKSTSSTQ